MRHYVRPDGLPPVNGFSHAVAFAGPMIVVSGQVPVDADGRLVGKDDPARHEYVSTDKPPASFLVQVSALVNPDFRVEVEALAATS